MIHGILMTEQSMETKIAVLEAKMDHMMVHTKELTLRVRANEKVVASVSLLGVIACTFIGAGYFAPKAEACSMPLDGIHPHVCPDPNDGIIEKPFKEIITDKSFDEVFPNYYNSQWDAGRLIQRMREWDSERNRTDPEDSINNALANLEWNYGSDDPTEQEKLLQFQSNRD